MNVLVAATAGYDGHPACFPLTLAEYWVRYLCPVGGVVLDPFSGSGTTGIAALKHRRTYVGIERNNDYIKSSRKRIQKDLHANPFAFDTPISVKVCTV